MFDDVSHPELFHSEKRGNINNFKKKAGPFLLAKCGPPNILDHVTLMLAQSRLHYVQPYKNLNKVST